MSKKYTVAGVLTSVIASAAKQAKDQPSATRSKAYISVLNHASCVTAYPQVFTAGIKGQYKLSEHDYYKGIIVSFHFLAENKCIPPEFLYP